MQEMRGRNSSAYRRTGRHPAMAFAQHTLLYREMELRDSFDAGIHRIMLSG